MRARLAIVAVVSSGCFAPSYPEGLACSELQNCPPGQVCDLDVLRCVAELGPGAPERPEVVAGLPPATGWVDEDGAPIQLAFAPVDGALYECRTGPVAEVSDLDFAPCDGGSGTEPIHVPSPTAGHDEGRYETQARIQKDGSTSALTIVPFYAHRSLDEVASCPPAHSDEDVFAAARALLEPSGAFAPDAVLGNPFIEIPFEEVIVTQAMLGGTPGRWDGIVDYRAEVSSLRRRFVLDEGRELLLVRRQFESRRARAMEGVHSCRNGYRFGGTRGAHPRGAVDCENLVLNRRGQSVCLISEGTDLVVGPTSDIGWAKLVKEKVRSPFSSKGALPCATCPPWYLLLPE
jgi:hypothetical protein